MKLAIPVSCLLTVSAWPPSAAAAPVTPAISDALRYSSPGSVQLAGHLGEEIGLSLRNRILQQDVEETIQPFRARKDKTEWRSEFWGKWITSAIEAYQNHPTPELRAKIEGAVKALIATQTPDGYIGAYSPANRLQAWDIWGRKYVLLGLLAWYDASGDPAALTAARREADFTLTEVGPGKGDMFKHDMWNGVACSSVLEPMVLLYRHTGDRRYLDFCHWLVHEWQRPGGPDIQRKALAGVTVFKMFPGPEKVIKIYSDNGHSKAYEMMSCFEGLIELYRTTGDADCLLAARKVYDDIQQTEITVIGSGSDWERWCNGAARQTEQWQKGMETCVTATWIKFSAQLLRVTGDPKYADAIELAAYNALLGAQSPDGSWWTHYVNLTGHKEGAAGQCLLNENCCVANGPRALMLLPDLAVMSGPRGPVVNLYGAMTAVTALPDGNAVTLAMSSDYPEHGAVNCTVKLKAPAEFTLKLRIPAWSEGTQLSVNGEAQGGVTAGQYAEITRPWKDGDVVRVMFNLRTRAIYAPGQTEQFALARGPIVLARDIRLGGDIDEKLPVNPDAAEPAKLQEEAPTDSAHTWLQFGLPARAGTVRFVDFASAGNTWTDQSRYRVWFQAKEGQ